MTSLAVDPVEGRIAARLVQLMERDGEPGPDGTRLPYRLTRQSLADMAGTTVETTIRTLSRWQRAGLVADQDGRLVAPDLAKLRAITEGAAS
jgi:CRP-like cAMP-binding protein